MITVGITGGIGSGKSEVLKEFQKLGAYTVNADDLAKSLMVKDQGIRLELIDTFGEQTYREDGTLNRGYLAEQAFSKGRVEELNRIVHPRMPEATRRLIRDAESEGHKVFAYEAALLLQHRALKPDYLDYLILVLAPEQERIDRVSDRDNATAQKIRKRMEKQQDFENLTHLADFVIENDGSLEDLKCNARELYQELISESK